jgi:hypothetical protein
MFIPIFYFAYRQWGAIAENGAKVLLGNGVAFF